MRLKMENIMFLECHYPSINRPPYEYISPDAPSLVRKSR
ncbi:hypothetical protein SAMN05192549_11923 [Duganella sacchari]|uniref:Uncharacterized protein n=1 Tax=Duganella sacchari TaxID=551987 RepID=A0A1M7RC35_9BURK|nr:hypothetical protein SAMN05192549_11923 [Duganella sacchari]